MAITTYAELKSAIADFLDRQDMTTAIPTLISAAEARISRDLSHWKQEKRVNTAFDERYELVPNDMIEAVSLQHSDGGRILMMSATEMQDRRGATENQVGKPTSVRLTAGQFELYPTPDEAYNVTLLYRARIPALTDTVTTNWLLTDAPDVLLFASLALSAPYLKDDARLTVWAALYQSAIDSLNAEGRAAQNIGALRMGVPR
jgi:hypothetical protein